MASRTKSGGGKSTVAPVFGSDMGMVPVYLAIAKAAEVGYLLLPLKKQLLLPLRFSAFMGSWC